MYLQATGLSTYRWNNNIRTGLLVAIYPFLIAAVCWGCVWAYYLYMTPQIDGRAHAAFAADAANGAILGIIPLVMAFVGVWFVVAWLFHTRMISLMSGSRYVTRRERPDLYNLLENLCIAQGVPMPDLYIIDDAARNAFASGINDKTYAITLTSGLINGLEKDEIEAVLAHELAHIRNNDARLLITSIIFCGLFGFMAQLLWRLFRHGGRFVAGERKGGPLLALLLTSIVILWLGYFFTLWSRFALSRTREFDADAMAVEMTKNPDAMMRALLRIKGFGRIRDLPDDISLMCIDSQHRFFGMFRTHPPIHKRLEVLSRLTGTPIPVLKQDISLS